MFILTLMMISVGAMFVTLFFAKEPKEIIAMLMAFILGLGFSMNVSAYEAHNTAEKSPIVFEWK